MDQYDSLKLENQLCFPLYVCAKEMIRAYKPFLDELDLTYTQYIAMMILWEEKTVRLKDLGEKLYLEANTLSPLVRRLEEKGYLSRSRGSSNKKDLYLTLSEKGEALKEKASRIPEQMASCLSLSPEQARLLYSLLYQMLADLHQKTEEDSFQVIG